MTVVAVLQRARVVALAAITIDGVAEVRRVGPFGSSRKSSREESVGAAIAQLCIDYGASVVVLERREISDERATAIREVAIAVAMQLQLGVMNLTMGAVKQQITGRAEATHRELFSQVLFRHQHLTNLLSKGPTGMPMLHQRRQTVVLLCVAFAATGYEFLHPSLPSNQ